MNLKALATLVWLAISVVPSLCFASDFVAGRGRTDNLLLRNYHLNGFERIDVKTEQCDGSDDTVLYLIDGTVYQGGDRTTRGYNDDAGSLCSSISYTNGPAPKTVTVVGTTYRVGVQASVTYSYRRSRDNIWHDESVTIGGTRFARYNLSSKQTFETVPLPPAAGGGAVDTVLYALSPTIGGTSYADDDAGLHRLAKIKSVPTSGPYHLVAGGFGNLGGPYVEIWGYDESPFDPEGDGVPSAIENARGTDPSAGDSDHDGATDDEELRGVAASDLTGGDSSLVLAWQSGTNDIYPGADPLVRDLWVEVDYMFTGATWVSHSHDPRASGNWNNFAEDLREIWANDYAWTGKSIRPHVEISQALPHYDRISFMDCPQSDNVWFYDFKGNPGYFDPLRASIYHYAIFAHNIRDSNCSLTDSSGWSEIWGNDMIISLGAEENGVGSVDKQRGTFSHELGHNVGLVHNGNTYTFYNRTSCVHSSVMNYKYQWPGWGDTTHLRGFGYSNGTCAAAAFDCFNTCDSNACVPAGQTTFKWGCESNDGTCDCDIPEWERMILDIPGTGVMSFVKCQFGDDEFCSGRGGSELTQGAAVSRRESEARGMRNYFLGRRGTSTSHMRDFSQRRRQFLAERHGLRAGMHYTVAPDTGRMYVIE